MTIQAILFIVLVGAFYGSLFHTITGGNAFTIFVDILISVAGFFVGHLAGNIIGTELFRIGVINFGWGTFMSFIFLAAGAFISNPFF